MTLSQPSSASCSLGLLHTGCLLVFTALRVGNKGISKGDRVCADSGPGSIAADHESHLVFDCHKHAKDLPKTTKRIMPLHHER